MKNINTFLFNKKRHPWSNADGPAATAPPKLPGQSSSSSNSGMYAAAASVINNTVDNLFKNKLIKSQVQTELLKARLMQLDEEQQSVLAARLQQLTDDNAKNQLLNDLYAQITAAQLNSTAYDVNAIYIAGLQSTGTGDSTDYSTVSASAANNQIKLAVIVLVAAVIVAAAAVMFKKQND